MKRQFMVALYENLTTISLTKNLESKKYSANYSKENHAIALKEARDSIFSLISNI